MCGTCQRALRSAACAAYQVHGAAKNNKTQEPVVAVVSLRAMHAS
jgi:hypothetical protein